LEQSREWISQTCRSKLDMTWPQTGSEIAPFSLWPPEVKKKKKISRRITHLLRTEIGTYKKGTIKVLAKFKITF